MAVVFSKGTDCAGWCMVEIGAFSSLSFTQKAWPPLSKAAWHVPVNSTNAPTRQKDHEAGKKTLETGKIAFDYALKVARGWSKFCRLLSAAFPLSNAEQNPLLHPVAELTIERQRTVVCCNLF